MDDVELEKAAARLRQQQRGRPAGGGQGTAAAAAAAAAAASPAAAPHHQDLPRGPAAARRSPGGWTPPVKPVPTLVEICTRSLCETKLACVPRPPPSVARAVAFPPHTPPRVRLRRRLCRSGAACVAAHFVCPSKGRPLPAIAVVGQSRGGRLDVAGDEAAAVWVFVCTRAVARVGAGGGGRVRVCVCFLVRLLCAARVCSQALRVDD